MQRIILVVIVLFVAWKILAAWGKRLTKGGAGAEDFSRFSARSRDRRRRQHKEQSRALELVGCSTCGTLVPPDRAVRSEAGLAYCSEACASGAPDDR